MKRFAKQAIPFLSGAICALALCMFVLAISSCQHARAGDLDPNIRYFNAETGQWVPMPTVAATTTDPYAVAYGKWRAGDKPMVICYGATWCPGCREVETQCRAKIDVQFTAVHLDIDRDQALIRRYGLPLPDRVPCCYVYPPHRHNAWRPFWHDQGRPGGPWFFVGLPGFRLLLR